MTFLKIIYVLALGALVGMLIGFGVAAFYEGPQQPAFPERLARPPVLNPDKNVDPYQDPEYLRAQKEYEALNTAYEEAQNIYRRNVFFIVSACGVVVVAAGLLLRRGLEVIRAGLLLGGTGALIYGVGQFFGEMTNKMRFAVIAVAVLVLIYLGYRKLTERKPRPAETKP
ncbi:MAG: hypothetical protein Q7T04_05280 [Dehalococcoidia bacterium]|nr:hypothetical protein [Dehalococcoidia bacterium]